MSLLHHWRYLGALGLMLASLLSCGDDDDPAPDAAAMDGAIEDAAPPGRDASPADAGRDAGNDGGEDGGHDGGKDGGDACPREDFPLWDSDEVHFGAVRESLAQLCPNCATTLAEFAAGFQCQAVPEDGGIEELGEDLDAGGTVSWWIRSEGCGSVQFGTFGWPRYYNFDLRSGELIGFARLDDIGEPLPGTPCISASWVAGEIRQRCDDEVVTVCHSLQN